MKIEEYKQTINAAVPDRDLYTQKDYSIRTRIEGFLTGCKNALVSMWNHPINATEPLNTLRQQIACSTFLVSAIKARDGFDILFHESLFSKHWSGSNADAYDELVILKNGLRHPETDELMDVPLRMLEIRSSVYNYNCGRNTYIAERLVSFRTDQAEFTESAELSADNEIGWGTEWKEFNIAAKDFFKRMSGGKVHFLAEPWSLAAAVSVFGSHPESTDMWTERPLVIIPFEQFKGVSVQERADILVAAYELANKRWHKMAKDMKELEEQDG